MKSEEEKYAELFIAMSMDFLQGKIDLEHYANTLNMANEKFQNTVHKNLTRQPEPDFDIIGEWKEPLDFDPDCLPAWAEWIAMDEDGEWQWHEDEPAIYDYFSIWEGEKSYGVIPKEYQPKNFKGHWKESLFSVEELRKDKELARF